MEPHSAFPYRNLGNQRKCPKTSFIFIFTRPFSLHLNGTQCFFICVYKFKSGCLMRKEHAIRSNSWANRTFNALLCIFISLLLLTSSIVIAEVGHIEENGFCWSTCHNTTTFVVSERISRDSYFIPAIFLPTGTIFLATVLITPTQLEHFLIQLSCAHKFCFSKM